MSAKRNQQQSKPSKSASKRGTPVNLNTTAHAGASGSGLRSRRTLSSAVNLNVTNTCPTMPISDKELKELECDIAYNSYLQALMKQQIVSKLIKKHEQDMEDQLAIQRDNLHKSKMALKKVKQEVDGLENMRMAEELVNNLKENLDAFDQLDKEFELGNTLKELLPLLESLCNKVYLKNVECVSDQESVDKLTTLMEKCGEVLTKIESSGRPFKEVIQLGNMMKEYHALVKTVEDNKEMLTTKQKNATLTLLKHMSDQYASKQKR